MSCKLVAEMSIDELYVPVKADILERQAYLDMARYIRFLAGINQIHDHWSLNVDDLTGEGFYALAKAIKRYLHCKPYPEFLIIAKTCVKNGIRTVRRKALMTRRRVELYAPSTDDEDFDVASDSLDPEEYVESTERIASLLPQLNATEQRVLNALLGGEERVRLYLELSKDRRAWIFKDATVSVDAWVVARAICEPVNTVESAFKHIGMLLLATDSDRV